MRGWIGHAFFLVLCFDHKVARNENGTNRHIAAGCGISGASERDTQIPFILLPARLERATPAFGGQYSIQLSYGSATQSRLAARPTDPSLRREQAPTWSAYA
jgi:hypothetical protein